MNNTESFRTFIESEEKDNVKEILSKLPKKHQDLLKGFKFKFTAGNTLPGDDGHVGMIHGMKITVAAPWRYGREFVFLHEASHLIFEKLMTTELKKEWSDLLKKTKKIQSKTLSKNAKESLNQNDEEIFAMSFATTYATHPPITYKNKEWQDFILKKVPQ